MFKINFLSGRWLLRLHVHSGDPSNQRHSGTTSGNSNWLFRVKISDWQYAPNKDIFFIDYVRIFMDPIDKSHQLFCGHFQTPNTSTFTLSHIENTSWWVKREETGQLKLEVLLTPRWGSTTCGARRSSCSITSGVSTVADSVLCILGVTLSIYMSCWT